MILSRKIIQFIKLSIVLITVLTIIRFSPFKLYYNHTLSMPKGWYIVNTLATSVKRGDLVAICLTNLEMVDMSIKRGYTIQFASSQCPLHAEVLFKRVLGIRSDSYSVKNKMVYINDRKVENSNIQESDHNKRPLPHIVNGVVMSGEVLVFGDSVDSFDSRYFGAIGESGVVGRVYRIGL